MYTLLRYCFSGTVVTSWLKTRRTKAQIRTPSQGETPSTTEGSLPFILMLLKLPLSQPRPPSGPPSSLGSLYSTKMLLGASKGCNIWPKLVNITEICKSTTLENRLMFQTGLSVHSEILLGFTDADANTFAQSNTSGPLIHQEN